MDRKTFDPGLVLLTVFLLWGIAGGVAPPEFDEDLPHAVAVEETADQRPPLRLLCHADSESVQIPCVRGLRADPNLGLVSYPAVRGDRASQEVWPAHALRCFIIED